MWKFPAPWKIISLLQIGGKSDYKWRKNFHRKNRQTSENYFKAIPWLSNTQKETQTRARCAHQVWCGGNAFRIYCESFCRFTNFNRISLSINFVTFDCHLSMASIPNCLHFHVFFLFLFQFNVSICSLFCHSLTLSQCSNVLLIFISIPKCIYSSELDLNVHQKRLPHGWKLKSFIRMQSNRI